MVNNAPMQKGHAVSWWLHGAALLACLCTGPARADEPSPWFDRGRPGAQVFQALELLDAAASHGLEPQDYAVPALRQALAQAAQGPPPPAATLAPLELALSAALQRYLADIHLGRIDPAAVQSAYAAARRDAFDPAAVLRAALAAHRLPDAAREAAPQIPMYEHLRVALARYRGLVGHPAWAQPLPALPFDRRSRQAKLEPGQPWDGLSLLAQRLLALGDLAAPADPTVPPAAAPRFEGPLVQAVQAFQERHGLAADGVLGKATLAQLQVPPASRVRQIELMLERMRWTPVMQGPRMVVINIPEFVLRAYEVRDGRVSIEQEMKVIVGKALDTRTPLFDADMNAIEFSPYWNVPPSIARQETVPRLRRDPGYFEREGLEFVGGGGRAETTLSAANLDAVLAGKLRLRQRPGPRNALGDIKFVFPNSEHIFLHHTPSIRLFERDRRDFSHGCIRVEQPVALAVFVLKDMPQWSESRIRQAMARGESTTLKLDHPVRVVIAYGTTLVKGGRIHFYDDIYGQDRRLDAALRQRSVDRRKSG
jgi:murein L,D-transpeptidase YcbB/YkuD